VVDTKSVSIRDKTRWFTGFVWVASVVVAVVAFNLWASNHLEHFGQSCPWGLPGEGHPFLVGALTVLGAISVLLCTRGRSHRPRILGALSVGAVSAIGALEFASWVAVGASHYCLD
jgi:hypothetical protein